MRILVLCYEFPPLGGGGANVVYGLSKELSRLGFEIDIVTMGFRGLPKHEKMGNVNVYRVPCVRLKKSYCTIPEAATYAVSAFFVTLRLLKKHTYQLNHTHFIFPDGLISLAINKLKKIPYIITAHGSDVPGYNPDRLKWAHKILSPVWKLVVRNAHEIICPSMNLQSLLLKRISHSRIRIIPNGINIDKFDRVEAKKKRILVVTRMIERKGVQYFLKALKGLIPLPEVQIVGDGPYLEVLKSIAKKLDVSVTFRGWIDNSSGELKQLYETSSIYVLTSESENFPIALLEAMAAGLAIITSKGTGCSEVVGDSALLVEPKNPEALRKALNRLTEDEKLCSQLGEAARMRLENLFSWPAVAKQYADEYNDVLNIS